MSVAKTEDFLLSLRVALFLEDPGRSGSTTVDRAGLIPTSLFEGSETRVSGNSARISPDLFFGSFRMSRGDPGAATGLAIVALKKFFHNPDGPLYKVPRTATFGEPAEATAELSR
jgi:hypothetical protein